MGRVLVMIFFLIIFSVGYGDSSNKLEGDTFLEFEVLVDAPRDFIFPYIASYEKNKNWIDGLQYEKVIDVPKDGGMLGTKFIQKITAYGISSEYKGVVTAYKENELFSIELWNENIMFYIEYILEDRGSETYIRNRIWISNKKFSSKLLNVFNRRKFKNQIENLKALSEKEYKT